MKKIILSFILFSVFAYVLACAWAINWIDTQSIRGHFFSKNQNNKMTRLNIAKKIWQITPAFDKEKDAKRAWIISELYLSYLSVNSNKQEMLDNLKKGYSVISSYRDIPDEFHNLFTRKKIMMINRSLGELGSEKFKNRIANSFIKFKPTIEPDGMMVQFVDTIEKGWLNYFHHKKDIDNYEWRIAQRILGEITEVLEDTGKEKNAPFYVIGDYHSGLKLCYDKYLSKENAEEHNIESQKIFQQLQQKMIPQSREYQILSDYLDDENANPLFLIPLISSNQTECEKEVKNFADKMVELANN